MAMSAYDRWKTTPPVPQPQSGDCLECSDATEWLAGRVLIGRAARQTPKALRRQVLASLRSRFEPDEFYCACCSSPAVRAKFDPCGCGAQTVWGCVCP